MPELTKETTKDIATHLVNALKEFVGLGDWEVILCFRQLDPETNGKISFARCDVDYPRRRGLITIDAFRHQDDLDEFVDTVRHEVLHITHHMWTRDTSLSEDLVPEDRRDLLKGYFYDACEEHVTHWERFLDRVGYSVEDLIDMLEADKII